MRFRAKLSTSQIQLLLNVISPISRLCGTGGGKSGLSRDGFPVDGTGSVIHLDPEHIRIFGQSRLGSGESIEGKGIVSYTELKAEGGVFEEHRIESVANNEIVFEIDLGQLKTALQNILESNGGSGKKLAATTTAPLHNSGDGGVASANASRSFRTEMATQALMSRSCVVVKLAKRNGLPCFCLDALTTVELHQAIPVRIRKVSDLQQYLPPRISKPDVQLELPPDRPLKPIVERLKVNNAQVFLEGSMAGDLVLRVDSGECSIRTYLSKLVPRFEECKYTPEQVQDAKTVLKVDSKKLNASLYWQNTLALGRGSGASSAALCMVENEMLVLHVALNPPDIGFFTYYVPVHFLHPEEMEQTFSS